MRTYDELWGEPVRAEDVLDGYELREYHVVQAERAGRGVFTVSGERLLPGSQGESVDAEGFEW